LTPKPCFGRAGGFRVGGSGRQAELAQDV